MESVTCRGLASSGATPGTGSSHRSCGAVSRSPMATTQAPSGSQPTDRQTPSHGLIRLPGRGRGDGPWRLGWPAATALRGGARVELADDAGPGARRGPRCGRTGCRRARAAARAPDAAAGLAVLAFARGQDDPVVAVGRQPDDLEPAVGVGHEAGANRRAASGHRHRRSARRRRPGSRRSRRRRGRSARSRRRPVRGGP